MFKAWVVTVLALTVDHWTENSKVPGSRPAGSSCITISLPDLEASKCFKYIFRLDIFLLKLHFLELGKLKKLMEQLDQDAYPQIKFSKGIS